LGGAQGLGGFAKAAVDTRSLFARRDAANKEGEQAQRDLEYAQKIGDNQGAQQSLAKRRLSKLEFDKLTNAIAGDAMRAQTGIMTNKASIYNADLDARTAAASRKTQERIAKLGGVEGYLVRLAKDDPEAYKTYMGGKAGLKSARTRAEQIDIYADDYNRLVMDMMASQGLKDQKINSFKDYIAYRDKMVTEGMGQDPVGANGVVPPDIRDIINKYKDKQ
jgi:hypothetical protein